MLHIIGIILKIIMIILAVILGILVLLACIVLFVPLRYQISAKSDGTLDGIRASVKFSWFLHLVTGAVTYENGQLRWKARAALKKFGTDVPQASKAARPRQNSKAADKKRRVPQPAEETLIQESSKRVEEPSDMPEETIITIQEMTPEQQLKKPHKGRPKKEKRRKRKCIFVRLFEKLKAFFKNIKYTFRKLCDKMNMIVEFMKDEGHRLAFTRLKKEAVRLLKFLKPKKFLLTARFGFEDPYRTGQVLAALSVVYPFTGDKMQVEPDFEEKVLEGELFIKGKIRSVYALIGAWNLFWDKNIRRLYADVKRMSGK